MNKATTILPNFGIYAIRLKPGQDLKKEIQSFVDQKEIDAGWITSAVGSLTSYQLRFANQSQATKDSGHFEIMNLSGTLSKNGSHIHISISDNTGKMIGGHLVEGCTIYTTAEIVIQCTDKFTFKRMKDGTTLWEELQIEPTSKK